MRKGVVKIYCGNCNGAEEEYLILDRLYSIGSVDTHNNAPCIKVNGGYIYFDSLESAKRAYKTIMDAFLGEVEE